MKKTIFIFMALFHQNIFSQKEPSFEENNNSWILKNLEKIRNHQYKEKNRIKNPQTALEKDFQKITDIQKQIKEEKWQQAIGNLENYWKNTSHPFFPQILQLSLEAFTQGKVWMMGYHFWKEQQKNIDFFNKDGSMDSFILSIGQNLIQEEWHLEGKEMVRNIALKFPSTKTSVEAYGWSFSDLCSYCEEEWIWENESQKRDHAKKMLLEKHMSHDIISHAYSLSSIHKEKDLKPQKTNIEDTENLLEKASLLFSARKYEDALFYYDYLEKYGSFKNVIHKQNMLYTRASCHIRAGNYAQGERYYRELLDTPLKSRAAHSLIYAMHYQKKYKEALKELNLLHTRKILKWPEKQKLWWSFWLSYLSSEGQNMNLYFSNMQKKYPKDKELITKINYWMGRYYQKNKNPKWKEYFDVVENKMPYSHYAIYVHNFKNKESFDDLKNLSKKWIALNSLKIKEDSPLYESWNFSQQDFLKEARQMILAIPQNLLKKVSLEEWTIWSYATLQFHRHVVLTDYLLKKEYQLPSKLFFSSTSQNQLWQNLYPLGWQPTIESLAQKLKIPQSLIWSIMRAESLYQPDVMSQAGALGLMQVMPRTGYAIASEIQDSLFSPSDLRNPEINITYGSWYLSYLSQIFNHNWLLAIPAYNAGPIAVSTWIEQNPHLELDEFFENIPYDQTHNYVAKVLKNIDTYLQVWNGKRLHFTQSEKLSFEKRNNLF